MKDVFEVWDTPNLLNLIESKNGVLMHENDGLIFTVDRCPYYPNIAPDIIKWKPPILNTIDFELLPIPELESLHIWGLYCIQNQQPVLFDLFMFDEAAASDFADWVAQYLKIKVNQQPNQDFNQKVKHFFTLLKGDTNKKVVIEFNHRNDRPLPVILLALLK